MQFVPFAVIKLERPVNELPDARITQMTFPAPAIQISFKLRAALSIIFNFEQCLPLGTKCAGICVCEMKGDELDQPRFIAVRQIATFMPTVET